VQRVSGGAGSGVSPSTCLLDGEAVSGDAALPLREHGVLLGDSVFETMRAYDGHPFAAGEHLERLERSAAWARLSIGVSAETLASEASSVARSVEGDSAVRIFVMRTTRGESLAAMPTRRLAFAEPLALRSSDYTRGVSACVLAAGAYGTLEAAHAKYARYLPRLLARDEARGLGFDEALLGDEAGCVVSGATSSVFVVRDDVLVTSTVLEGITRATVVRLAREMGLAVVLRPIAPRDIEGASEVFLTSSLREIVPVVRVGERVIGTGEPGKTTRDLHAGLRKLAAASGPLPWAT
jgi:branched-chain amino acid aminotransferase